MLARHSIAVVRSCRPAEPAPTGSAPVLSIRPPSARPAVQFGSSCRWSLAPLPVPPASARARSRSLSCPEPAPLRSPAWSQVQSIATLSSLFSPRPLGFVPADVHLFDLVQQGLVADLQFSRCLLAIPMSSFQRFLNQLALRHPRSLPRHHFQRRTPRTVHRILQRRTALLQLAHRRPRHSERHHFSRQICQLPNIAWPVVRTQDLLVLLA